MSRTLFKRAPLSAAVILLSGSLSAHAIETTSLDKVIVSATRSETVQLPLASTIIVIDEEQIRQSGATQIAEVLRIQAGIQLQDLDGSGGRNVTIGMRGFTGNAANNTLVLVDGRRLNNASLAGPALNTVAIKDIERIEIVQGSAGVLYGDQAVGGVINIITKRATPGELNGSVQLLGGSDNLQSLAANVSQGFANGVSYTLSAQKRDADNYRDNNELDYTNVLANVRYDFARGHVFAEGLYVDDQLNLPGSLTEEQAAENPRQTFSPDNFSDQETESWRVGGGLALNSDWELLAEYSDRTEDSYSEFSGSGFAQTLQTKNLTPRLIGSFNFATGNALVTLGYDRNEAEYSSAASWGSSDTAQDSDGYYGQLVLPLTQSLTTTLGARYNNVKDFDNLSGEHHSASLNAQEFGLSYQLTASLRAFARYAEGFRFANADENGSTPMDVTYLAPQTSESQEIGLAWDSDLMSATLTAYNMDVDNEIMYDSPNFVNINLPQSERQGVILDSTFVLSEKISLRTNYTYTDAQLAAGSFSGNSVPYVAENTANLAVIFTPLEAVTATVDANYTGSRYLVGDDANNADKIESVTLLNANVLWAVMDNLELGLRVKNLTDETYADYNAIIWNGNVQYPQPGRTFSASVTYNF
jgi:iron complex outermembrane receptor protein